MTGNDPDYISSMEHFESMRHEEIYAKAQQIDAEQVLRASATWLEVAGTLTASFPLTRDTVDREMNSVQWQGATADAAYESTRSFAASVDELAGIMTEVSARLGGVAAAAEAVKLAVVPPGTSGPVGAIAELLESAHVIDAQAAQEVLRQEAVLAMNMVYKPAYRLAGTGVPALPPPPLQRDAPQGQPRTNGHAVDPSVTAPDTETVPVTPAPNAAEPNAPEHRAPRQSAPETPDPQATPAPVPSPAPAPSSEQPTPPAPTAPAPPTQAPTPTQEPTQAPPTPDAQAPLPTAPPIPEVPDPDLPQPPPIPDQGEAQEPLPIPEPEQPQAPPPIPGAGEPTLTDPGGQPGITGPIPDPASQNPPSTTNQPGVVPSKR
ncbi:hypothetical protein [Nocardia callitridis]|uniref:PPE family domain-containing protein n=1 Tax=Nocardia callitridis TaxID=648753 RepID=A0ABP9L4D5_9NOCA